MAEIENLKIGNGTIHIVGNQDIVADSWEAGKTYVADRSYVIREHILYVCNTTHTSVEPFDPTKWTATTIGEALGMAGSANVIECTLAEYTAWKAGGLLINETTYILTDAPNLNATANDLSMGSAPYASGSVGKAIYDLNKPTALTISGVPTGVTSNSKAYKISEGLILIMVEVTFSSASTSWQNAFDIAWSGNTIVNAFGALSNDSDNNTYAQAFWNTDKITVRVSSPKATLYRGQILVPAT